MTFEALPAILLAGAVTAVVAYLLTPLAMRIATRLGAIDEPDSGRRIHSRPIPRAGGLAVVTSFVSVGLVALILQAQLETFGSGWRWQPERPGAHRPAEVDGSAPGWRVRHR